MVEEKNTVKNEQNVGIVVDDGFIKEKIINTYGDVIGVFCFRPADFNIIDRYNKIASEFDKIVEPLENVNISADGSAEEADNAAFEALAEAKKRLFDACDYLFDGNMSEAFFGKTHPFAPVKGHFYCEIVLNAVGQYISKHFERETKKIRDRVNRYTHGYRTGKHKNGRT